MLNKRQHPKVYHFYILDWSFVSCSSQRKMACKCIELLWFCLSRWGFKISSILAYFIAMTKRLAIFLSDQIIISINNLIWTRKSLQYHYKAYWPPYSNSSRSFSDHSRLPDHSKPTLARVLLLDWSFLSSFLPGHFKRTEVQVPYLPGLARGLGDNRHKKENPITRCPKQGY